HSHTIRWKDRITGGKFENPQNRQFHETLVRTLVPQRKLRLTILRHGNTPLAYLYAFDYKGRLNLYNIATESFYEKKSAGIILLHLLTEQAVRDGYNVVDFSRGEGGHKERFINDSAGNYQFKIYSSKSSYYAAGTYDAVKRNKLVERMIRFARIKDFRDRLASRYKRDGFGGIIEYLLKGILEFIIDYKKVGVFRLEKITSEITARDDIRVEQLKPEDIEMIGSFMGFALDSEKYRIVMNRFSRGGECYVLRCDESTASMGWVTYGKDYLQEAEREIEIGVDQVLLADFYTSPIFRGRGYSSYLIEYVADRLISRGKNVLLPDSLVKILRRKSPGKFVLSRVSEVKTIKFLGIGLN
ncbi:MAG: GNAT family N-acetyltransferase, partial [Candidatus Zixiibacteriota bacterium]